MKLNWKTVPKKVKRQIKYLGKSNGYKIKLNNGQLSPETYFSKIGAAAMIMGVWDYLE